MLADVAGGFVLELGGAVVRAVPSGLEEVVEQELSAPAGSDARQTLQHAIERFRARGSSEHDQLDALRSLAAVLESIRPQLKEVLETKDESDLFQILNSFGIRHADAKQQGKYDRRVFLPWLFYSYVAAIHAAFQLIDRSRRGN
jgi:hypothetical protein